MKVHPLFKVLVSVFNLHPYTVAAPPPVSAKKSKYSVKEAIVLESQFEKEMDAKAAAEAKAAAVAAAAAAAAEAAEEAGAEAGGDPEVIPDAVEVGGLTRCYG